MSFLVALSAIAMLSPTGEIGELSKDAFLKAITDLGYSATNKGDSYEAVLKSGPTTVPLGLSFYSHGAGAPRYIGVAEGTVMFDVPRPLPKKTMRDWLASQKLVGLRVHSFLGGKVALSGYILTSPKDTPDKVKENIERLLEGTRRLTRDLRPQGGKQSNERSSIGRAAIDLNFKLEEIEPEDLDNMREQWKWGNPVLPGGGKGWSTGAQPLGIPIVFSGMYGSMPGFYVTCMAHTDPEKYKRFNVKTETLTWASVGVGPREVYIQKWLDTSGGKSVREIRDQILDFAKRIKNLDVL